MTQPGASRNAAIVLFLIAGALLLGIGFFVSSRTPGTPGDTPALRIERPLDGDVVSNPVTLRFTTPANLRLADSGWGSRDLHLHLMINGTEYMPAAADIIAREAAFEWRMPHLQPGPHHIHLTWAGRHHGNLAGPADTITITIDERP